MNFGKIILISAMVLKICSVSVFAESSEPDSQSRDPLKIIFVKDNAPFSLQLPDGTPSGLYVEFWQLWSETNDVPVVFVADTMANNFIALKNNQVDLHVGLFVSRQRQQWGDFSLPIHRVDTGVFFRGNQQHLPKLHEMSGQKVAVQRDTYQQIYLEDKYPQIKVVLFDNAEAILTQFLNGEVAAVVSEVPYMNGQIAKMGLRGVFKLSDEKLLTNEVHGFIPQGKRKILALVNNGIKRIPVNKIIELEKKWLPDTEPYFSNSDSLNSLNSEEKEWLKSHSHFKLGIDHSWSPFEYVDNKGKYVGLSSDYVDLVNKQLAITLQPSYELDWNQAFEALKKGEIDVVSAIVRTDERAKLINFTEPYISLSSVITTRKDAFYVQGMDDLLSKKVGVINGYVFEDFIRNNHPNIPLIGVATVSEGLEKLKNGEIDAFIDALASINFEINKQNHSNIIVAAFTPYKLELSMGVRKGLEPLVPILDKALSTIDTKQKSMIANNWLSVEVNVGTSFKSFALWAVPIVAVLLFIILFVFRANRRMQFEIVERKKVELSLEKSKQKAEKANKAKDEFLANMSHEIRTPMNAVVGMSHLLEKTSLDEEQQGYIETLNNSSASLLLLIDDILDLSKIEVGKLSIEQVPFSLTKLLINVVQQIKIVTDESVVTIATDINDSVPKLLVGDGLRLGQILLNLAGNAAKFTPHGNINIRVTVDKKNDTQITLHFVVEDTGIGMSDEQMSRLFQTYSQADSSMTRRYGGTGLGLSICKKLCELMQGKIWVVSEKEKGSQFHFTSVLNYSKSIDVNLADSEEINLIESLQQKDKNTLLKKLHEKRILLVDDNLVNLTIAKKMLNNSGMIVDIAMNGQESLDKLNAYEYDCVLMDIQMPVMDGYQATKLIRESSVYGNIPVIGLSANVMEKDISRGRAAGMDDYLGKPISLEKMLAALSNCLSD